MYSWCNKRGGVNNCHFYKVDIGNVVERVCYPRFCVYNSCPYTVHIKNLVFVWFVRLRCVGGPQ